MLFSHNILLKFIVDCLRKAKSMLPNMPDEVFNTWLLPIIRHHKMWPYLNVLSPHPSLKWSQYFGLFTLNYVSNCLWYSLPLTFGMGSLDPLSNRTIDALIKKHVYNLDTTGGFNVRDSKVRFFGFVEFIKRTRTIPAPIIGIKTDDGIRVIDGNHRLAALTHLDFRGSIRCRTWVGGGAASTT